MKLKSLLSFVLCILLAFLLSGCMTNTESISQDEDEPDTSITTDFPYGNSVYSLDEKALESADLTNDIPDDDPPYMDKIVYDGNSVSFYWLMANVGEGKAEYGLRVFVEGVMQEIECDGTNSDITCVNLESGEQAIKKITFTPNVGKEGDTLNMFVDCITLPSIIKPEKVRYWGTEDKSSIMFCRLVMNADSVPSQHGEICKKYSNMNISDVNTLMYQAAISDDGAGPVNRYYDYVGTGIYKNIDEFMYADEDGNICSSFLIKTEPSEKSEITVNLNGKTGTYRICLMLNNTPLNIFDGYRYADVKVEKAMQTELKLYLDTTGLSENNKLSLYYYALDDKDNEDPVFRLDRTDNYTLIISN